MSTLEIRGLRAGVDGKEILHGIDLEVSRGEVHAVMGPNGAGKSTLSAVVMGRPGYEVLGGSVTLDGVDMLALPAWQRAAAGLYLVMQYPTEVPGVRSIAALAAALRSARARRSRTSSDARREADRIGFDGASSSDPSTSTSPAARRSATRRCSWRCSGRRSPILDELDSGLDIDALRDCAAGSRR